MTDQEEERKTSALFKSNTAAKGFMFSLIPQEQYHLCHQRP